MSAFKRKLETMQTDAIRYNTGYSAGVVVDASQYLLDQAENNAWVRSVSGLNNLEYTKWAQALDTNKAGFAVVHRMGDGADHKVVINPKNSCGAVSSSDGKPGSISPGTGLVEAEMVFAAGKVFAPTIVAMRSHDKNKNGRQPPTELAEAQGGPPKVVDPDGKQKDAPSDLNRTAQGTNAATGSTLKTQSSLLDRARIQYTKSFFKSASLSTPGIAPGGVR